MSAEPARREAYEVGEDYTREVIAQRSVGVAGFLLPHLRPGMHLLDCGCGPGSITVAWADVVHPGPVVGIDLRESDLQGGRALARERSVVNVTFQVATIYALPFAAASFDAVFANAVLQHLGDPLAAIREMRRVVKPGGVVGIADPAWHRSIRYPTTALLDAWDALIPRTMTHNGGNPFYAPSQRALLREAGFSRTAAHGRAAGLGGRADGAAGTLEDTRLAAQEAIAMLRGMVAPVALEQRWVTPAEMDAMAEALSAWGEHPDAFRTLPICSAIGWV
jgi:SAM-dependent methyltransferase